MLETISAKVTAAPGVSGWAQVHEFISDDPEKLRLRGRLFAVVSTKRTESEIDTISSGRELIGRLHEEYFGNLESKPFDVLRSSVQKVATEFKQNWGDVEIVACSLVDGVVYSAAFGGGRVVISRDGGIATILESNQVSSQNTETVASASGYPKNGDVMLLATNAFFEKISLGVAKAALTGGNPGSAAETFGPIIHGENENGTIGAVIIKFEEKKNPFVQPGWTGDEAEKEKPVATKETPMVINDNNPKPSFVTKLSDIFKNLSNKLPRRNIYIKSAADTEVSSHEKKLTFSVGLILLLILIVSIGFGIKQKKVNDLKKRYEGMLQSANQEVDDAIGLASVSPEKSRELFIESEQKLNEILALKVKDAKIDALKSKIEESRGAILGEYEASPELFVDLSLLSSGFKGDEISFSGGNIYILDKAGRRIASVVAETKKSKVFAGPSVIDNAETLASYQDEVFILSSDGIYQVGATKTKVIDKTWGGDALISAFAGNLYVLDKTGGSIYRYSGTPDGTFGAQQRWLSASVKPDFGNAVSWAMDGAIYVLYPNSRILKYSLGSPQGFSLSGIIPEIGNVDAISADSDNQYVYLLDKAGKRVVVTDKKGKYKAQYVDDQVANATGLIVSESQKEIILLTGDKLLSIGIRHL